MNTVRYYLAGIVLGIWTVVWWLGFQDARLTGFFLALLCVATVIQQRESRRRRRQRR